MSSKDESRGIFTEATVRGLSSPSFYDSVDLEKYKKSSPKYDWKASKTQRITPLKKTPASLPEVSPMSYKAEEVLKKKIQPTVLTYSYSKEKERSFIARY